MVVLYLTCGVLLALFMGFVDAIQSGIGRAFGWGGSGLGVVGLIFIAALWPLVIGMFIFSMIGQSLFRGTG